MQPPPDTVFLREKGNVPHLVKRGFPPLADRKCENGQAGAEPEVEYDDGMKLETGIYAARCDPRMCKPERWRRSASWQRGGRDGRVRRA